ncbi:MAG: flagellin [Methanomicrobium sp.]|nr:flagellin [Methanomicrobium sp.]
MHMRLCREEGFTGLEAAIVLIAFVVVASVFSYAVLGAGFYTTSKTQEVIYSAVDSAGSTPQLLGNVYGIRNTENNKKLEGIQYSVVLASGGKYIDFSTIDVTWSTSSTVTSLAANSPLIVNSRSDVAEGKWGIVGIKPDTAGGDAFLEPNEIFTIYVNPDTSDEVSVGERFNIEMKSPKSGAFAISRTCPDQFDAVTVLN